MDQSVLLEDVMYIIMSFSDRPTVSRMMRTCRTLHRGGVPHILRDDVNLCLSSLDESFFQFLLANLDRRLRYLRGLSISPGRFSSERHISRHIQDGVPEMLNSLFTILATIGTNFTRLELYDAEDIFQLHPRLPDTLASLTELEEVKMSSAGSLSCKMLRNLQSRLFFAEISLLDDGDDQALTFQDKIPATLLQGSRTTLKHLSISDVNTTPSGPRYNNLTVLEIVNTYAFITQHYVRTFPGLMKLYISDSFIKDARNLEQLRAIREANIMQQDCMGTWKSLCTYAGPLGIMYALGLTCRITRLQLDDTDDHGFDHRILSAVLSTARPSHLTIMLESDLVEFGVPEVISTLRERCAQDVEHLHLEFYLKAGDTDYSQRVRELFDVLSTIIDSSAVTTFKLFIKWPSFIWGISREAETSPQTPNIDLEAYADMLLAKGKKLRSLELHVSNGMSRNGRTVRRVRD
ncbi:hypothetical protein L226DRAFT_268874 [Lentinus tigrinus ALCF2SS1-7]|uniref:F-box domain-containing protein n=1 Tax=Lentinus tigrinus ALCF2SS1-6 TaxID=1328759 RepID=A0A5C2RS01_9APHY|nr:hypothetical protein L227DRAFT_350139 [Lentinus tigrinus ALCF2SS1-6]RPD69609.1 hypothetical protein L226DRAFT_268874 [Lentinus tigrinus ALCF2SS1-7]